MRIESTDSHTNISNYNNIVNRIVNKIENGTEEVTATDLECLDEIIQNTTLEQMEVRQ